MFGLGRYREALQAIDELVEKQEFMGLHYKTLILCLRGEVLEVSPLLGHIEQLSSSCENKNVQFVVLALKTCLYSYQGREQEIYQSFNKGQELLNSLKEYERDTIKEWEGWLHYIIAYFYQTNGRFEKPITEHLQSSLNIFESLPEKRGKEWVLRYTILYFLMTNQLEVALEYLEALKEITIDGKHVFDQVLVSFLE